MTKSRKTWQTPALGEATVRNVLGPAGASGPMQKGLIAETEASLGPPTLSSLSGPPGDTLFGPSGLLDPPVPTGPFGPNHQMASNGPPISPSDIRLKEDIVPAGVADNGLPLYEFSYRGQPGRYEGVMAQDVLQVRPDAVTCGADGYYRVDYTKLGLKLRRLH
jgi:hypothetical protein